MSNSDETVQIRLSIKIDVPEGDYDTGLTVEQWNALSAEGRSQIVSGIWSDEASGHDNGGMSVSTDGAEEI